MALKLGQRPADFKAKVTTHLLSGESVTVEVTYKYRTRTEYAQFVKDIDAKQPDSHFDTVEKYADLLANKVTHEASLLKEIVTAWDLDAEFNDENIQALCDQYPAVIFAISDNYQSAITRGLLGN